MNGGPSEYRTRTLLLWTQRGSGRLSVPVGTFNSTRAAACCIDGAVCYGFTKLSTTVAHSERGGRPPGSGFSPVTGTICSKLVSLRCCWQRPQHMRALNYRKLNHGSLHWELGAWLTTLALTEHTLELLEMNVVRMKRH